METTWWVNLGASEPRNVTRTQLSAMAAAGTVARDTLVCPAGGTEWIPAGRLDWLTFPGRRPAAPPPARTSAPPPLPNRPRATAAPVRRDADAPPTPEPDPPRGSIDLAPALNFVFKHPNWATPVLVLAAVQYVPILGFVLTRGWRLELARRVYRGHRRPLPDWSDLGKKLVDGLTLVAVWALYELPTLIASFVMAWLWLLPYLKYLFDSEQRDDVGAALTGTKIALRLVLGLLVGAYALAADALFLAGLTRFVAGGRVGAFFELATNFRTLRRHADVYVRLVLFRLGLNVAANLVRGLLAVTGVGAIFIPGLIAPPLHWTSGHLFGQAAAAVAGEPDREDR